MKKTLTTFLAIATLVALAAPAIAKPNRGPGKAPKVTVSIETHLFGSAHELGDLLVYVIDVTNNSSGNVDVTDLTGFSETVLAGKSATFEWDDEVDSVPPLGESSTLINTVTAFDNDENAVASDTVETSVYAYEECYPDEAGVFTRPEGYSVCIWKPIQHGAWTLAVTPEPPGKKPVSILMNLRDHVPGNWCPFTTDGVAKWRGEPATLTFQVTLPAIPPDWHGEAICPNGGAGGDPMGVGSSGSFYLATYGKYHVKATPSS